MTLPAMDAFTEGSTAGDIEPRIAQIDRTI